MDVWLVLDDVAFGVEVLSRDGDRGTGVAGEALADGIDPLEGDGATEARDPGVLEGIGVLDGAGRDGALDPRSLGV